MINGSYNDNNDACCVERVAVGMRESSKAKRLGTRQAEGAFLRLCQPSGAVSGDRKTSAVLQSKEQSPAREG